MKVCTSCFSDKELKGFISSSNEIGDCDICESNSQPLLSVSELFDFFQELLNNFKVFENGMPLSSKIQSNWSFFSSHAVANKILNYVLPNLLTEITSSNINVEYTDDIIENYNHWEVLKEELKWKNRFVIDIKRLTEEEFGWDEFFNTQFKLDKDVELFRARLHHKSGMEAYQPYDMYCPKKELASGGRANPSGIPFLYLSDNPETVLYEVRASYLDELSVGTFQLKSENEPIKLVDFTEDTFLFQPNSSSINKTIKGKLLRQKISSDLSKPMRRYDSELEYIPTQFICEFIKVFTGALGIRFNSSLHPKGNNIVLFDKDLMTCIGVKKVKINSVNLQGLEIKH
ncbi:RES domain-containing protein [Aquiflexum balticum DSM 16537]|uniref:RES domain-containing protein n=1 Tax=Aquiflexum balticum DSM 16537 TaxID=758820 RepID=A0A1W2H9G7_9BACT|nr:RES domain-containing protein [Aquiflexum balticum]SMD45519.1 RES domain-containing protein [Aquiflexum balticum DSM 16537]